MMFQKLSTINSVNYLKLRTNNKNAIKQINETIDDWVLAFNIRPAKMDARVVASSIPNPKFIRADLLRLENRLYEYGKGDVLIASKYLEEDV